MKAKHLCMDQRDQLVESKLFTIWIFFKIFFLIVVNLNICQLCALTLLLVVMRAELWLTYVHFCIAEQWQLSMVICGAITFYFCCLNNSLIN